jgi:hypothetical protein
VNLADSVAGGGKASLRGGRHIGTCGADAAGLHLTLLIRWGPADLFADSKGKIKELLDPVSL